MGIVLVESRSHIGTESSIWHMEHRNGNTQAWGTQDESGEVLEPRACHRKPACGLSVRSALGLMVQRWSTVQMLVWGSPARHSMDGKGDKRGSPIERWLRSVFA